MITDVSNFMGDISKHGLNVTLATNVNAILASR